jgi:hypothetical protein
MSNKVRVSASPSVVRAWAEFHDLIPTGQRGRLDHEVIEAYNAKNGLKHVEGKFVKTVKVSAKPAKGRTVTRTVSIPAVRAAAIAANFAGVGQRGRLSKAVLDAYVLGTLTTV